MSKKLSEHEIDEIFKNAIEPVNTEPSPEFWRKAAEGVITRGANLKEGNSIKWKIVAFVFGAALLILGYFTFKLQNGLKSEEQQITMLEKGQGGNQKSTDKNSRNSISFPDKIASSPTNVIASSGKDNKNTAIAKTDDKKVAYSTEIQMSNTRHSSEGKSNNVQTNNAVAFKSQSYHGKSGKKASKDYTMEQSNENITTDSPNAQITSPTETQNSSENLNITSTQKPVDPTPEQAIKKTPVSPLPAANYVAVPAKDSLKLAPLAADTAKSRFSVSDYFSPDIMLGYKFICNTTGGSAIENIIKAGEKQSFSYTTGVKAEYMVSTHFAIMAGIMYQSFKFNANPGYIYAQKQSNGDVTYSIPTSSGVVDCPYYGKTYVGDSLKMNATSSRTYLSIPVRLKYFINKSPKLKLYITGGVEANISLKKETYMDWQNSYQTSESEVNNAQGAEKMYLAYYISIGADYSFGRHISMYVEPGLHNAITPIDNNIDVIAYPRLFSATAGLTYHF